MSSDVAASYPCSCSHRRPGYASWIQEASPAAGNKTGNTLSFCPLSPVTDAGDGTTAFCRPNPPATFTPPGGHSGDEGEEVHSDPSLLPLEVGQLCKSSPVISKSRNSPACISLDSRSPTGPLSPVRLAVRCLSVPLETAQREGGPSRCGVLGPDPSACRQKPKGRNCCSLPELSPDTFRSSCELEKENTHFALVDMVLEVLEAVKWTLSLEGIRPAAPNRQPLVRSRSEATAQIHRAPWVVGQKKRRRVVKAMAAAAAEHTRFTQSLVERRRHTREEDEEGRKALLPGGGLRESPCSDPPNSAERLAQQLVLHFKRAWLPGHTTAQRRQSLHSLLQELPGTKSVANLVEEIRLRSRMRGTSSWAPPRFQIIFTVQPAHRRSEVMASQHFLCAGCGTAVEPRYIKRLRYCEYFGRYFCDCCHSGSESVIPGRVLSHWDFGRYPVSDFSKELLESLWHQPLFDLTCVGKTLYGSVKELDRFREVQEQLLGVRRLLRVCRSSQSFMAEFEQLPTHLVTQPHLFSMDDLLKVKKGQLVTQARALLTSAVHHVVNCQLCSAHGFICEFCRDEEAIFPFQIDVCKRCPACKACFHKRCLLEKECPKCLQVQLQKKRTQ